MIGRMVALAMASVNRRTLQEGNAGSKSQRRKTRVRVDLLGSYFGCALTLLSDDERSATSAISATDFQRSTVSSH